MRRHVSACNWGTLIGAGRGADLFVLVSSKPEACWASSLVVLEAQGQLKVFFFLYFWLHLLSYFGLRYTAQKLDPYLCIAR